MSEHVCMYCNNSGVDVDGNPCTCGMKLKRTVSLDITNPYTKVEFDVNLLPEYVSQEYKNNLDNIIKSVSNTGKIEYNALICSPIGTGKTVFSHTLLILQKSMGVRTMPLYDLFEVRDYLLGYGNDEFKKEFVTCPLMVIRIPLQLPYDVGNLVELVISRRVRNNCFTIFTYSSEYSNLINYDKAGVIKQLIRDGTFCTVKLVK